MRNVIGGLGSGGGLGSRGGFGSGGGLGSTGGWGSSGGLAYSGGSTGSIAAPTFSAPAYSAPAVSAAKGLPLSGYAAPAVGYGSTGGLYSGAATADYYGQWGMNYLQGPAVSSGLAAAVAIDSYDIVPYNQTGLEYSTIESVYGGGMGADSSSPLSYDSSMAAPLSFETDYAAPVLDYGAVPSLPTGSMVLPQVGDQMISTPSEGTTFGPVDNGFPADVPNGGQFGPGLPDAPVPDAEDEDLDSTRRPKPKSQRHVELASRKSLRPNYRPADLTRAGVREAVLGLSVPRDARVYINEKLTATPGTLREYVSRRLKSGKSYTYRVKVVVERDGSRLVRSKLVRIKTGTSLLVKFDFARPPVTRLVLKVPADAKVLLDGQETRATGKTRTFSTKKLTNEQSWRDYQIEVRYNVHGKEVVRQRALTLSAGMTEVLEFGAAPESTSVARK